MRRGVWAETAVVDYLFVRGYVVLARNLRLGVSEIDVVARRGSVVALVEVRTRSPWGRVGALASITATKRRHLLTAAARYVHGPLRELRGVDRVRIDVAVVDDRQGRVFVEHLEGAITA